MRVLQVDTEFRHHSRYGGYGQLSHFMNCRALSPACVPFAGAPETSWQWNLSRRLYDARILLEAMRVDVLHLFYAEFHLRLLSVVARRLRPRLRMVGTIHLPLDFYSRVKALRALHSLHAIIALSRDHAAQVREALPDIPVFFVPYGLSFCPEHFTPGGGRPGFSAEFVTVGSNYRAWSLLVEVVRQAARAGYAWTFHLVGVPDAKQDELRALPSVVVHPRLDEPAYFALLGRCRALFLPLTFATANTAILEAHNAGLPICCSDLPGTRDYALSTTTLFKTAEEALACLCAAANTPDSVLADLRRRTYEEGRRFSWENIVPLIEAVYREVCS